MTLFLSLAETSQRVAATAARLAKVRELAALLAQLSANEIGIAVQYLSGEMPQGRIGVGPAAVRRAAATAPAPEPTLSVTDVDERLTALAATRGAGSAAARADRLRDLFALATGAEQRFLLQLLVGELRQGALEGVMLEAIASAAQVPVAQVRRAAMYSRHLGAAADAAMLGGAAALSRFQLELFVPVAPMLAQTAADVGTALRELGGEAAFEWKMDGARIQVHRSAAEVRIYTRGLNDVSAALPEIVELVRTLPAQAVILDGEVIALDAAGRPHPFQITMRRVGRRLDVEAVRAGLPLKAFFFDCLRLEAQSIADRPAHERFAALATAVPPASQMPRLVTGAEAAAREYYEAALAAGHEGLVAKSLIAPYEAGNRGAGWLKIKRAHTLDLVVLAAEWGHGRRSGKLSNLHLGALDPATGRYVMLGKTFKGLTDAMLEWQTREFLQRETHRDEWTVYLRPELVVEIAFSDLQASSRYPGGLALRLARVKRYRDDKSAAGADTMETVRRIYAAQSGAVPG
ncbi:MAG: ATP-dependent DNA ligase [Gammaproteobacteria bacterium]|nr:ATP-dependent DNA ligase [Gammaproteobacteria bacterium]